MRRTIHSLHEAGIAVEAGVWSVTDAGRLGLPTRIGLEDTTVGPGETRASDNAELVRPAVALWNAANAGPA